MKKQIIKPILKNLSNGLKVLFVPLKETRAVTVSILVKTGADYETEKNNGISHFLEHMLFKGTKKRPNPKEISTILDGLGADYNASTSREYTNYYIKTDSQHLEVAIDMVSDIYLNSLLDKKELEKERGVILEEINLYEDIPSSRTGDIFNDLLYNGSPFGREILGSKKSVNNINREELENYFKNNYTIDKTLIVVSGNFNQRKVIELINKKFKKIRKNKGDEIQKFIERDNGRRIILKNKDTDQAHFILGMPTFSRFDKRRPALNLISAILGGGTSSRLWLNIRENLGAAYYIGCFSSYFSQYGHFGIYGGAGLDKTERVISEIKKELKDISSKIISKEEFEKAKNFVKGKLILGLETSDDWGSFFGFNQLLRGEMFSLASVLREIDSVKIGDVLSLSKELFNPKNLRLAMISPFKKKDEKLFLKIIQK